MVMDKQQNIGVIIGWAIGAIAIVWAIYIIISLISNISYESIFCYFNFRRHIAPPNISNVIYRMLYYHTKHKIAIKKRVIFCIKTAPQFFFCG